MNNDTMFQAASAPEVPLPPVRPGRTERDPGSRTMALVAWIVGIVVFGLVVVLNQASQTVTAKTAEASREAALGDPDADQFAMAARAMTKLGSMLNGSDPGSGAMVMGEVDKSVREPLDRARAAIIAVELVGLEKASERLEALSADAGKETDKTEPGAVGDEGAAAEVGTDAGTGAGTDAATDAATETGGASLASSIEILKRNYAEGSASISEEDRAAIVKTFGWFGKLALKHDAPKGDAEKASMLAGGGQLLLVGLLAVCVGVFAFFGGVTAAIVMLAKMVGGKIRRGFVPPETGGSVYLEMVVCFVVAFLVMALAGDLVFAMYKEPPAWILSAKLATQWLLLGLVFYPLLRGVPLARMMQDLGLHRGAGFWKEVWAGVWGYFAGLPLLFLAFIFVIILLAVKGLITNDRTPPSNPMQEIIQNASGFEMFMLFTLATIWAPLVEEVMFRGALYRHVRSRVGMILSSIFSALAFGFMHGYPIMLLAPVITIGFNFALMREWRGSLIGSITAHAMHNATILTLAMLAFSAIG